MKAAYLTHSILKIFDEVEIKDTNYFKIVNGLKSSMYKNNVPQSQRVLLENVWSLNLEVLKSILGDLVTDDIYDKFEYIKNKCDAFEKIKNKKF